MKEGCCKNCQKRYPACWGSCPDYAKEKEEKAALREAENKRLSRMRKIQKPYQKERKYDGY